MRVEEERGPRRTAMHPPDPTDSASGDRPEPGPLTLGDYRIVRRVGQGGMGVVYEAVEVALGRTVALKVLGFHDLLDPSYIERFLREARAAAKLHHTHIVPVLGVGEQDGIHYYTMQFIRGPSLDRVLRAVREIATGTGGPTLTLTASLPPETVRDSGQLLTALAHALVDGGIDTPAESTPAAQPEPTPATPGPLPSIPALEGDYFHSVARIGRDVADALAHAHREGIVHRDIKPSNLLLDDQGSVWVTDFGLAKAPDIDESLTMTGNVVGTIAYMAPERFEGRSDGRVDIYSLGVTLYEMLTLRPAFRDPDRRRLMRRVAEDDPIAPRKLDPRIPRDLETIVLKAMAKDPAKRYPSGEDLAGDLQRFLQGEPIRARAISSPERLVRWARRRPMVASLTAAVFLLLVAIAVGSSYFAFNLRERLYDAYLNQARAGRLSGRPGRRFDSLEAIRKAAGIHATPELRDEAIACFALADLRAIQDPLGRLAGKYESCAFDAQVERYVTFDPNRPWVSVRRVFDESEITRLSAEENLRVVAARFSSTGRYVAASLLRTQNNYLRIWDLEEHSAPWGLPYPLRGAPFCFSHDDRRVALVETTGQGHIHDTRTHERSASFAVSTSPSGMWAAASSPWLAILHERGLFATVIDFESGKLLATLRHPTFVHNLAWSPDARLLAAACADGAVYLWSSRTWSLHSRLERHSAAAVGVAFSNAGDIIASGGWDGSCRLWNPWTGELLVSGFGSFSPVSFYRGDTRLLSSIDVTLTEWDVAPGRECRSLRSTRIGRNLVSHVIQADPTGRFLAFSAEGIMGLWDLDTGREHELPDFGLPHFLPSGDGLVVGSMNGLLRFDMEARREGDEEVLWIGAPRELDPGYFPVIAIAANGRTLAAIHGDTPQVLIFDLETAARRKTVEAAASSSNLSFSGDGRWLAAGTWKGYGARVWDATRGELVKEFPGLPSALVAFHPSGERLVVSAENQWTLYDTRDWTVVRQFTNVEKQGAIFSPDGRFLVTFRGGLFLQLLDPLTGADLSNLDTGTSRSLMNYAYSADSGVLYAAFSEGTVQAFDMRRVRAQLGDMGLDWDMPPIPARRELPLSASVKVRVDTAGRGFPAAHGSWYQRLNRGRALAAAGDWKRAVAALESALEKDPDEAPILNDLAWTFAVGPPEIRDPARALPFIEKALAKHPVEPALLNTLGVIYYRLGRNQEALDTLLAASRGGGGNGPFDWLFLAMSLEKLGHHGLARDYYQRAVEWMERPQSLGKGQLDELERFRVEAAAVLDAAARPEEHPRAEPGEKTGSP